MYPFGRTKLYEQQMQESIDFLRGLGFFEQWKRMTSQGIARKLENLQKENNLAPLRPGIKRFDLELVAWDEKKVWFESADAFVLPGNEAYIQALQELSGISKKVFTPTSIEEIWEQEEGPIVIRFSHKRKKYELRPQYADTYFDYGIIKEINNILDSTRNKFEICKDSTGNPMVIMLDPEQKNILQTERKWKFADTEIS